MRIQVFIFTLLIGGLIFCSSSITPSFAQELSTINISYRDNPYYSRTDTTILQVSNTEWQKALSEDVFRVARLSGTERAFTGKYWNYTGIGTYYCAVCGNALFRSDGKFASECGWPSFFETLRPTAVTYKNDLSHNMERIEVNCGRCGSHLGHLFDDGPPPTYQRYCMNSIILDFEPDDR